MADGERPFPGPQDSLADALEGGLSADTAAVGVDATLEGEREREGTETSHRAERLPTDCTGGPASSSQTQDKGRIDSPHQPGRATPPCLLGHSKPGPSTRAGSPFSAASWKKSRENKVSSIRALCRHQLRLLRHSQGLDEESWDCGHPPTTNLPRQASPISCALMHTCSPPMSQRAL